MLMASDRPILIHSAARRPLAGFWSRLVASAIAPFGYGGDLWSRRDRRWRHRRVERLFAGFFATLIAYVVMSFRRMRPGRELVQRRRVRRLLRGYHRALIVWALEPYRFAWAWELGEGRWTRARVQGLLAQCFMVPFAWAALESNGRIDWRRLASRRLVGGLSMTMVACTAMAFGSGPSFEDHRDESQAPRLMASYGAPTPDVPSSDPAPTEQSESPGQGAGGFGGAGGGAPQNGGSGGSGGDGPAADGPDFPAFDPPPPDGLMTLANYTPPGETPPTTPDGESAAPGDNGNPGDDPGDGLGGLGGLVSGGGGGGGGGGGAAGGGGGGGGFTPPTGGDPGAPAGPGDHQLITIATGTPQGDGGGGWDGCMVDCSMTPPSGSPAPPTGGPQSPGPQSPGPFGPPPDNGPFNGPNPPIASVPEPTTWVMMLLGFGGLGAAIRRRRRQERLRLA